MQTTTLKNITFMMILINQNISRLSYEGSESLEGYISLKDAAERLYKLKSNKSPGSDGLFKVFWNCIDVFCPVN